MDMKIAYLASIKNVLSATSSAAREKAKEESDYIAIDLMNSYPFLRGATRNELIQFCQE